MNIAYIRKTDRTVNEVAAAFKSRLADAGIEVVGEQTIRDGKGTLIFFFKSSWTEGVTAADPMLVGLVPSAALIETRDGKTAIGIGNPQIIAGGPHFAKIESTISEMDRTLRSAVNAAAGVGDPKREKVKLYSTATCPYCRMEKDYLEKNGVAFDLIMVDQDRHAAEEIVQKTGQTGVPITEVLFDDGDAEFVLGFDKGRLNDLLKIGK